MKGGELMGKVYIVEAWTGKEYGTIRNFEVEADSKILALEGLKEALPALKPISVIKKRKTVKINLRA